MVYTMEAIMNQVAQIPKVQTTKAETTGTATNSKPTTSTSTEETGAADFNAMLKEQIAKVVSEQSKIGLAEQEELLELGLISPEMVAAMLNMTTHQAEKLVDTAKEGSITTPTQITAVPLMAENQQMEQILPVIQNQSTENTTETPLQEVEGEQVVNTVETETVGEQVKGDEGKVSTAGLQLTEGTEQYQTVSVVERLVTTTPTTPTERISETYLTEIKETITSQIAAGNNDFEIQLEPHNLGQLTIKATYEDGKAIISILCSDKDTMQILAKSAGDIAAIMENRSGQATEVVVDKPALDYLENQANDSSKGQHQQENTQDNDKEDNQNSDFMQQLRLGLL